MAVLPVLRSPMIELALTAADRNHGVDRLDAGLERLVDGLPCGDAGSHGFERPGLVGGDRPLLVDRLAERVDDAADDGLADRHAEQGPGRGDRLAFFDPRVFAEDHHAHRRFFEVQRDPLDAIFKRHHLARHQAGEAVNARDAVSDLENLPDFARRDFGRELFDLTLND